MASNSGNQLIAWLHEVIARVWVAVNLVAIRYRWNCGCAAKPCSWRYATNSKIVVTLTGSASQWKVQADRHLRLGVGQGGLQHTMHLQQKPFSVGQVSVDLLLPSNLRRMTIGHDHSLKRCPCILDCWSSRHFRQNLLQFLGILKMYRRRWWWHAQNSWLARIAPCFQLSLHSCCSELSLQAIAPRYHSVWSYCSLSNRSLWTESETTFSLKLILRELSLVVNWKWNTIQFEAIAPWAIAHCELKVKQHSVWSYRSLSYRSLWTESETTFSLKLSLLELLFIVNWKWNNIQFEAIAPWAIAHCELKVKQHSVWSYCSLRYSPLWTESETTFSLKLLLLELTLVVKWKWSNIQFEAIAPWANARREMKVKQSSLWSYCSLS